MSEWLTEPGESCVWYTLALYHFVDFTFIKILVMCSVFWAWFFFFVWPLAMKLRNSASRKNSVSYTVSVHTPENLPSSTLLVRSAPRSILSVLSCVSYRSKVSLAKKKSKICDVRFSVLSMYLSLCWILRFWLACLVIRPWPANDSKSRASCRNHLKSLKAHDSFNSLNDKNSAGSECNAGLANCIIALWARMPKLFRHCTSNFLCFKARRRQLFGGAHSKRQVYRLSWSKLLRWAHHRNTRY